MSSLHAIAHLNWFGLLTVAGLGAWFPVAALLENRKERPGHDL